MVMNLVISLLWLLAPLIAGAQEFVKGASPRALETMPPQPAPAEPVTTKKLDGDSHGKAAARWCVGGGPCLVTDRP